MDVSTESTNEDVRSVLEQQSDTCNIHPVAAARLLAVAANPRMLQDIGKSTPLLMVVIRECGSDDTCAVKYDEVARECGVAHGTVKKWAATLEEEGFIVKEPAGKTGVRITIRPGQVPVLSTRDGHAGRLERDLNHIKAVRDTAVHAFEDTIEHMQAQLGGYL